MLWKTRIKDVGTGMELQCSAFDETYRVVTKNGSEIARGNRAECRKIFDAKKKQDTSSRTRGTTKNTRPANVPQSSKTPPNQTQPRNSTLRVVAYDEDAHSYWMVPLMDNGEEGEEVEWHFDYLLTECLTRLGFTSTNVKIEGDSDLLAQFLGHPTMDVEINK